MRFQIKKLLEGYDPADLIEQSMYCFGSDDGGGGGGGGSSSMGMDDDVSAQASVSDTSSNNDSSSDMGIDSSVADQQNVSANTNAQDNFSNMNNFSYPNAQNFSTNLTNVPEIGIDAFGGIGGAMSNQSTAGIQSALGDMVGGSMSVTSPTGQTTTYSPTQVPALELMNPVPYDVFNVVDKVNQNLRDRDAQGLYSQVTRDDMGNVTGSFNTAPAFGLGFMPNVTTYTGFAQNPYNEDMSMSGSESEPIKPATTNPVSGQPICPDGYRFDDDLQACRLDTTRPNRPNNPNPFPANEAYYRATTLDKAPLNLPSGFDFNRANQNFVSQFAYRPSAYQNQMGLSGFTPFRRS